MRDFLEVIGQIWLKQETEPKCVIQGGERLLVREPSETMSRDPPSSGSGRIFSWYSRVLTKGHLEEHSSCGPGLGTPAGSPTPGCASAGLKAPVLSPPTQGRSGSGYLMNRMPMWRLRSSRRRLGVESTWRPKTKRFGCPFS